MKNMDGLQTRLNHKSRLIVLLNDVTIEFKHHSTFDISLLNHYSFRLRIIYLMYYILKAESDWIVIYSIGLGKLVKIDRFTVPELVTEQIRFSGLDLISKVFGRQNLLELLLTLSLRCDTKQKVKLSQLINFVGDRIQYG